MRANLVQQLFVVAQRDAAGMRIRLVPIRAGGDRAAALNRDLGIVPLEVLGQGDHTALTEVYHVFRGLDLLAATNDEDRLVCVFSLWKAALAQSGIGLRVERRALYGTPMPRTDRRPTAGAISIRPWDVEFTALAAGLRTIVKLDRVPPELAESLGHTVARRGLRVEVVAPPRGEGEPNDPAGSVTLVVARDASALAEARNLETLLLTRGAPGAEAATVEMGALLGYPRCCVERFTRIAEHNDTTLAWALLPGLPHAPAPPLTQWLQPGLALLSHSPCDLHCPASIALGARILEAIDAQEPGFTSRWQALAARFQVVDWRGNRLALALDGRLDTGATVTAADVLASGGDDPDAAMHARALIGRTISTEAGGLVAAEGDWYAAYVADHSDLSSAEA
jgi:hypothetical protein